jgi:glycosyltransferase involved in cell wall biosynthesis
MKVWYLLDSLAGGGAEYSTARLAPAVRDLGVDTCVVTLRPAPGDANEAHLRAAAVDHRVLEATSHAGRVRELRKMLRAQRPDVLHTAIFTADQVGRVAAWGTRTRVVSSLISVPWRVRRDMDDGPAGIRYRMVIAADAVTSHLAVDHFHAVCAGVAAMWTSALHLPADKVTVVERGRDRAELGARTPDRRAAVRARLGVHPEAPVVLAVGRQQPQKGHAVLIDAAVVLADTHPDLVVLVAGGEGTETPRLQSMAADPRLAGRVHLLGHRTDVADLLAAADVMALPSRVEGTAGVALEAMGVGTPIVSSRLDGLEGILVDGYNALLVPPGDPHALAKALARVLDDPALAAELATAGAREFERRFTLARSAAAMVALYRHTLAG